MDKIFRLFLLGCFVLPTTAMANNDCTQTQTCIEVDRWDLGIAVGIGSRSNPIVDHDNIPVYVAPSIAYYGNSWFFDNGNLGYSLIEREQFTINLATLYTAESGYFNDWDPSNFFVLSNNRQPVGKQPSQHAMLADAYINLNELEHRHFTLLGSVEAFYYSRIGIFKFVLGHDILDVHNGMQGDIKWNYSIAYAQWLFDAGISTTWKSKELIQYYYGVRESENQFWHQAYQASSGWSQSAEITTRYLIDTHWDAVVALRYTKFADAITSSPLLSKGYSTTYFVGMAYKF
ncbi:MipA/OmpV family protein [Shewanella intestini]|uniref:MipA/OmpV family protein n=1 Tax=Shewanella intestini TaxID=2017544 RepID=A0ABS5HXG8_9GAMM|nr:MULTISPECIES: MipA/OmpV family protein [Shewanella]MBR9726424.1 MipA/OmpV family protein [Shewanella intestini]